MDGDLGAFRIKPDQIGVINPLLILLFIPLYEMIFYPLLAMLGIRRPLQKLTLGGIFAGLAFLISGFVEIELEKTYAILPKAGEGQLRIFNGLPCDYTFSSPTLNDSFIESMSMYENMYVNVTTNRTDEYTLTPAEGSACAELTGNITLEEKKQWSFHMRDDTGDKPYLYSYEDYTEKPTRGYPKFRILINSPDDVDITINANGKVHNLNKTHTGLIDSNFGTVTIKIDNREIGVTEHKQGGVYTYLFSGTRANMVCGC
jgi:solute carrier family 15 oligopeptide transporter 1